MDSPRRQKELNVGDLIQIDWSNNVQVTGVLLGVRKFSQPRMTMTYVKYSLQILDSNGNCSWHDVWNGDSFPRVIRKKSDGILV